MNKLGLAKELTIFDENEIPRKPKSHELKFFRIA